MNSLVYREPDIRAEVLTCVEWLSGKQEVRGSCPSLTATAIALYVKKASDGLEIIVLVQSVDIPKYLNVRRVGISCFASNVFW